MERFIRGLKYSKVFLVIFFACLLYGCEDTFQFNPNEVKLKDDEKGLNAKNISKIQAQPVDDTLRFILISDTHHEYEDVEGFVKLVNGMTGISFVAIAGDFTNFGLQTEYREANDRLKKLNVPYIAVIGNHDLLGNGSEVFEEMFGSLDFSFAHNGYKFIGINTNSREYGFDGQVPNISWLKSELQDTSTFDQVFVIGHVPPYSNDFDSELESAYATTLASSRKVKISMHGHKGDYAYDEYYNDGVNYLVTDDMKDRAYVLVKIWSGSFSVESKTF